MERTLDPVLSLRCPRCRARFDSSLRLDEGAFMRTTIPPTAERCRSCGQVSRYEQRDYYFEPADG